ncbi:hypothetical protein GCM10029992_27720 [Glycomyces albus]
MSAGQVQAPLTELLQASVRPADGSAGTAAKLARVAELAAGSELPVDLVAIPGARPLAIAQAAANAPGPVLAVTATSREAEELVESLASFVPEDDIALYPAWETLPHERLSPRSDTVGTRLELLHRIHSGDVPDIIVTPVRGALQPQLKGLGALEPIRLRRGEEADLTEVAERLLGLAYERVDLVEKRGEFAVRGGILDVFPPTAEHPLRLEFFGDEIDAVREFSVADQRSLDEADGLVAVACRELLLTAEVRAKAAELAETHPGLAEMCAKLGEGIPVEGMESLMPVLVGADRLELFSQTLPKGTLVVAIEPERIRARAVDLVETSNEFLAASWAAAAAGAEAPVDLGAGIFRDLADARRTTISGGQRWWTISPFAAAPENDAMDAELAAITGEGPGAAEPIYGSAGAAEGADDSITVDLGITETPRYHGDATRLTADLKSWTQSGKAVAVVYPALGGAERAAEQLRGAGIGAHLAERPEALPSGEVTACVGTLAIGFESDDIVAVTASDIAGGKALAAQRPARARPSSAAVRSTRSNSRPATTWSTTPTASASTSRWCGATSAAPNANTW